MDTKNKKELNVLFIGQTGVGKSTFINSIYNYLRYDSFEEVEKHGVVTFIPMKFTVIDDDYKPLTYYSSVDGNEISEDIPPGESLTRQCQTYTIPYQNVQLNIIDTPGVADTRGVEQDKENVKMILDHIRHLDYLHGICILLKPNETRLNAQFKFCIMELLTHLHKDSAKNIIFCFTNTRAQMYKPGESLAILKRLLYDIGVSIVHQGRNIICLDNEAYKYLCTFHYDFVTYNEKERSSFMESWYHSVQETKRMIELLKTLTPHHVKSTVCLNEARRRILTLNKPLNDVTQNLQYNIALMESHEKCIRDCISSRKALLDKLFIPVIKVTTEEVLNPRTVCTSRTCTTQHPIGKTGISQIEYTTVCHYDCEIEGIIPERYPDEKLKKCKVMKKDVCTVCGCGWEKHMQIFYKQRRTVLDAMDPRVHDELQKMNSLGQMKKKLLNETREKIDKLYKERDTILQNLAQFGQFLKENSITPYNDGVKDYMMQLIATEEGKSNQTENDIAVLELMKKSKEKYEEEVEILADAIKKGSQKKITPSEVHDMTKKLYNLESTKSVEPLINITDKAGEEKSKGLFRRVVKNVIKIFKIE